jgi:hypothetical protein
MASATTVDEVSIVDRAMSSSGAVTNTMTSLLGGSGRHDIATAAVAVDDNHCRRRSSARLPQTTTSKFGDHRRNRIPLSRRRDILAVGI